MCGYKVECCFGWDIYGLFVEFEVECQFGIIDKFQIEVMGIVVFNDVCCVFVLCYIDEWQVYVIW